jgi:hypothetical protein
MPPLSPALLIACASGLLARWGAPGSGTRSGRGRAADAEDGASVAFVHQGGYHAHLDHDSGISSWPLPAVRRAMELADYGRRTGVLATAPQPGDIALRWDGARQRFVHAAIVIRRVDDACLPRGGIRCRVLDAGATSARGRVTTYDPDRGDRFLRWVELERRAA